MIYTYKVALNRANRVTGDTQNTVLMEILRMLHRKGMVTFTTRELLDDDTFCSALKEKRIALEGLGVLLFNIRRTGALIVINKEK